MRAPAVRQSVARGGELTIDAPTPTFRYQFSSCSRNLQGTMDFVGNSGPATLFEVDVVHGYDITRLSYFGEQEAEVRARMRL